ncbi:MAG TPA: hypothetical protein DC057_13230 [Spirochaetia bacterium]|nr:hypothetical protein [Spirochaetia bacterium]
MKRIDTGGIRVSSDEQKKKGQMVNAYLSDILRQGVDKKNIIIELARSGSMDEDKDMEYKLKDGKLIIEFDLKKKRPMLYDWLINNVAKNGVKTHYITKWDRLARNIPLGLGIRQICKQYGTEIVATSDTNEDIMILFSFVMAQTESDRTKQRVDMSKQYKFDNGLYLGTHRLYGYQKSKILIDGREYLHLIPNPTETYMIQDIYSDMDYKDVKRKYKINAQTYYNIKSNSFYCGYIEYNGEKKLGIHQPLISEELWNKYN